VTDSTDPRIRWQRLPRTAVRVPPSEPRRQPSWSHLAVSRQRSGACPAHRVECSMKVVSVIARPSAASPNPLKAASPQPLPLPFAPHPRHSARAVRRAPLVIVRVRVQQTWHRRTAPDLIRWRARRRTELRRAGRTHRSITASSRHTSDSIGVPRSVHRRPPAMRCSSAQTLASTCRRRRACSARMCPDDRRRPGAGVKDHEWRQ